MRGTGPKSDGEYIRPAVVNGTPLEEDYGGATRGTPPVFPSDEVRA